LSSFEGIEETTVDRTDSDRRDLLWRTIIFGYLRSRRRTTRRVSEGVPIFTDYHHPWLFFLATGIMILSCFDAFLTLQLIDRGAIEINPFMAVVIDQGTLTFAATKMLLTSFGILALVFLARARFMRRFRTGLFLTFLFSSYAILVCYEFIFLIQQI
jgi:Domain of unknown function (DUF5658)